MSEPKMTDAEVKEFKLIINREIDFAIQENGGLDFVRDAVTMGVTGMVEFVAGWVARSYWIHRQASLLKRMRLTQEEIRRVHDLVRLKLDTGSTTS